MVSGDWDMINNNLFGLLFVKFFIPIARDAEQCGNVQTKCDAWRVISCTARFRWPVDGMSQVSAQQLLV